MKIPHLGNEEPDATAAPNSQPMNPARLWTPWRMEYIGGESSEAGCVFCNRLAGTNDVQSLILWRDEQAFVIMNLFPYNTGHVMIVPNEHVASPEGADLASLAGIAGLQGPVLRAIRRALGCDGFNLGSNIGAVSGAGIADHLHLHVVPRWTGDANFMPILASVKVLPELVPVTYAKLRAELAREQAATAPQVSAVALSANRTQVILRRSPAQQMHLPCAQPDDGESCWRAALRALADLAPRVRLVGWAGPTAAGRASSVALTFQVRDEREEVVARSTFTWFPVTQAQSMLTAAADRAAIADALANLAPVAGRATNR